MCERLLPHALSAINWINQYQIEIETAALLLARTGYYLKERGQYTEAEPLLQQALALTRRLLGEEHPSVASSLHNLALLYDSQGRYSEAEPLLQQALALKRRLLGEEHPDVALSLNNLALLYLYQGRWAEAEPLFQQALKIASKSLGVDHPNTITVRANLKLLRDKRYSILEKVVSFVKHLFNNHGN